MIHSSVCAECLCGLVGCSICRGWGVWSFEEVGIRGRERVCGKDILTVLFYFLTGAVGAYRVVKNVFFFLRDRWDFSIYDSKYGIFSSAKCGRLHHDDNECGYVILCGKYVEPAFPGAEEAAVTSSQPLMSAGVVCGRLS